MYLNWRKEKPSAANNEIILFHHIWQMAREWGYTKLACPSEGIKKHKLTARDVYVEDHIFQKVYEFADQTLKDLMDLAYLTGQRPVDIVKIHRSHIFDDILHITQQKTGKKVRFEIIGKLKEIIDRRINKENQWLFTNKWGGKLSRNVLSHHFAELRLQAMETYPELADEISKVQLRDLRAKAATDISLIYSTEDAQKQLGYS